MELIATQLQWAAPSPPPSAVALQRFVTAFCRWWCQEEKQENEAAGLLLLLVVAHINWHMLIPLTVQFHICLFGRVQWGLSQSQVSIVHRIASTVS